MKWSMVQLQKFMRDEIVIDETAEFSHLKERDPQIREISPIRIRGRAEIESKKVTFHLHITGEMILPSSRTLRDVRFPIDIYTDEVFVCDFPDPEADVHFIQGEMIDLAPVVEELILLEIPLQIYSEDDDHIPSEQQSGSNWNFITDEDELKKDQVDPRLAKLAELFKKDNKKD